MKYSNIQEEELKNKVGVDWFRDFDTTTIVGNIDFTVLSKQNSLFSKPPILWAEAKTGDYDVSTMLSQLILTIGKERTFDKINPPAFIGAFDFKKIVFIDYVSIEDIFYINDFNWNVAPSNHKTKEFGLIQKRISDKELVNRLYIFDFIKDEESLRHFIKRNVANATTKGKIKIHKNNFLPIFLRWSEMVKPLIDVNWEELKKNNILESDFFLADLFIDDNDTEGLEDDSTIRRNLFVVFENQGYRIAKENIKQMFDATIYIRNTDRYIQFWKVYKRPPLEKFQDYIIERRDLLVPQDVRERKGAFFTPKIWVEKSQEYLSQNLGENWQDEYVIWDCAAGTGNLLNGLVNKYNIFASTLDQADISVIHERIDQGANLLKSHVFQFDFLNNGFDKLPIGLQEIINDEKKRKKLIIYINPPYAEATNSKTVSGTGKNKAGVTTNFQVKKRINEIIGPASNELFALFLTIIYEKIPDVKIGLFSKLKFINGSNFRSFKNFFLAEYIGGFVVPADTFDNVKGKFPIGFTMWDTSIKSRINNVTTTIYDRNGEFLGNKIFYGNLPQSLNRCFVQYRDNSNLSIGLLSNYPPDFQNQSKVFISILPTARGGALRITRENLIPLSVYFAVRHSIKSNWLNDRDQFLWPEDSWLSDIEFQNNCLVYTIFSNQNKVSIKDGENHWIPFSAQEIDAQGRFQSSFMYDFIEGSNIAPSNSELFNDSPNINCKKEFSLEAQEVLNKGKELWKYYHTNNNIEVNGSLMDIKEFFQGRDSRGRLNSTSGDEKYNNLLKNLKQTMIHLEEVIVPKIYYHNFLRR